MAVASSRAYVSCPTCGGDALVRGVYISCGEGAYYGPRRVKRKPCKRHKWGTETRMQAGTERLMVSRCERCGDWRHVEVSA